MRKVFVKGRGEVRLGQREFVGQGGQASVFARGGVAYKLFVDPSAAPRPAKLAELAVIADDSVIKPLLPVADAQGALVGYTMRYLPDTEPLCRLFTRSFREKNGISHAQVVDLVMRLRDRVDACHRAGVTVVDLNEMNVLVGPGYDAVYLIDTDSFQTPGHPATALMDSVRDRHAPPGVFNAGTDWFSFAVVSFQLFCGVHPYKGKHPKVKGLDARMRRNLSVFDPAVGVPKSAWPVDVIPEAWRAWYRAVLEDGARRPPPRAAGAVVVPSRPVRAAGGALTLSELGRFDAPVRLHAFGRQTACVITEASIYVDGHRTGPAPRGRLAIGFSPRLDTPVVAALDETGLTLIDAARGVELPFGLKVNDVACGGLRLYARAADQLVEIRLHETGTLLPAAQVVGHVLEHATQLYDGVALQNLLGATYASLLPGDGGCHQVRLPELDGYRVLEARFDRGVLMVLARREGRADRLVYRFARDFAHHDLEVARDVQLAEPAFVVLDSGVCVHLTDDHVELFAARPGSGARRRVDDPLLGGDLALTRHAGGLAVARGEALCALSMS